MDFRTVRAKLRNPTSRQRKAARLLAEGKPTRQAMLEAGYSEATAHQGTRAIPAVVMALMPQESNLIALGKAIDPEQQENLVRGRLVHNVLKGRDAAVQSAYRLGQDKRVNMFTPENQTGIVILNAPQVKPAAITVEIPEEETE